MFMRSQNAFSLFYMVLGTTTIFFQDLRCKSTPINSELDIFSGSESCEVLSNHERETNHEVQC